MNISPVSFRSTTASQVAAPTSNFSDIVNKPQTYVKADTPAATGITEPKKKKSVFGTIAKLVLGAAAVAGALVAGNKFNLFSTENTKNALVKTIKTGLSTAATYVEKGAMTVYSKFQNLLPKAKEAAGDVVEDVIEANV